MRLFYGRERKRIEKTVFKNRYNKLKQQYKG